MTGYFQEEIACHRRR